MTKRGWTFWRALTVGAAASCFTISTAMAADGESNHAATYSDDEAQLVITDNAGNADTTAGSLDPDNLPGPVAAGGHNLRSQTSEYGLPSNPSGKFQGLVTNVDCVIDQDQPSETTPMAAFDQEDLAQSFVQTNDTVCGAGLKMTADWGTGGNVYIELWDRLPNDGGTMLASSSDYARPGEWIDVFWPSVSVIPGQTYYLVFYGDDSDMAVSGDTSDPYPNGMVFANTGFQSFPTFDYTFRTYFDQTPGDAKYSQPHDCDGTAYYSNLNSNTNSWLRFDDFICTQTGGINEISFWGGSDFNDPIGNVAGFQINFYRWLPDGPCEFFPGEQLCSYQISASDVTYAYECQILGFLDLYKYTVSLPEECYQEEGQHFVIRIAAQQNDPDLGDNWFWGTSTVAAGTYAASYNQNDLIWECGAYDQAFEFFTAPEDGHVKYSQPIECDGTAWWSNINSDLYDFIHYDDFTCNQTGDIEVISFWGGMYGCGPKENLQAFQIEIYEWTPDGPCGFYPGVPRCAYLVPASNVNVRFECEGPSLTHYKYRVPLPEPCYQEEGERFVIMIAAVLEDPDLDCAFYWSQSTVQYGTAGASYSPQYDWICYDEDSAFELFTDPGDVKYAQGPDCENYVYFSNKNSTQNSWLRFDDFICQQTGDINRIEWWGLGFDLDQWYDCGLPQVEAYVVEIFKWEQGGECDWQPGALLCRSILSPDDVMYDFECNGPNGDYVKFTADLPEPCFQEEGSHYALSVSAVLSDPDDRCIFGWLAASQITWSAAASYNQVDQYWSCGGPDQAFAFYTAAGEPCPGDANGDNKVDIDDIFAVLGAWGPCNGCPEDVNGDNQVDIDDIFMVLGNWGPC